MADPTKPVIDYSYSGFQLEQQINPFPGTQLDNDLQKLADGIGGAIDAVKDIRRADGALKNGIVKAETLAPDVLLGAAAQGQLIIANFQTTLGAPYGVGNGVADDSAAYAGSEAVNDALYLPPGKIYNLGSYIPSGTKLVSGPGAIKINNVVYKGFQVGFDPARGNMFAMPRPDMYANLGSLGGSKLNVILSPGGGNDTGNFNRTVGIGYGIWQKAINIDRCVAIGINSGQFSTYMERTEMVGSNTGQWLGSGNMIADGSPMWFSNGVNPGQAGWDYNGMETRNPGIGAKIAAVQPPTQTGHVYANVLFGRDTGAQYRLQTSTIIGYRALGSGVSNVGVTAIGKDAFWDGVLLTASTALGVEAGMRWQEGTRNTVLGNNAGGSTVKGDRVTNVGGYAGYDYTQQSDNIFLGHGAGNMGLTAGVGLLAIGLTGTPLISGNLGASGGTYSGTNVGVNIMPGNILGTLHVRTAARSAGSLTLDTSADDLVIESAGNTGATFIAGTAGGRSQLYFTAPTYSGLHGGIGYSPSTNRMVFRAGDADRMAITNTGMGFNGTEAIPKPTVSGAKGGNAALTSLLQALANYGLITDSTT